MYDAPMTTVAVLGVAVANGGTLPFTGTNAVILATIGFVLLATGAVMVALRELAVRRHQRTGS
jgi:hypothetical protein